MSRKITIRQSKRSSGKNKEGEKMSLRKVLCLFRSCFLHNQSRLKNRRR